MTAMIEISNAEKTFTMHLQGGVQLPVVRGVSFFVEPGECVVLAGPSGAGKSSILKMIFGNYRCDHGRIGIRHHGAEIDLAKAELGEKARQVGGALGFFAAGAMLVIPALVMVLFALSAALMAAGWSQPLSYLTSAIAAAVIAGVLFAIGINRLDSSNLAPRETMRQLEKDKDTVKGMVR